LLVGVFASACEDPPRVPAREGSASAARPDLTSPTSAEGRAIARATECAKNEHGGVGQWKSALRFDAPTAWSAEGVWYVAFPEVSPKGKPQGLTLVVATDGTCRVAATE
jgi:hypothetical protein